MAQDSVAKNPDEAVIYDKEEISNGNDNIIGVNQDLRNAESSPGQPSLKPNARAL